MRLTTWNCRVGGFRRKVVSITDMRPLPDILAIQEIEPIKDVPVFAGDCQPTYRERSCVPEFPRRGFGMFSYTETKLRVLEPNEPFSGFRRYEADHEGRLFNVAGVWPWATKSSKTSYRQAHDGLRLHDRWIRSRPTILLGDFNANASTKVITGTSCSSSLAT